jgi:hypothetical protein
MGLKNKKMEGIQYLKNDAGEITAVQIDLKMYNDVWKGFMRYMEGLSAEKFNNNESVEQKILTLEEKNRFNRIVAELKILEQELGQA